MPIGLEHALMMAARRKGLKGKRKNAFVYGIMRKTGWKPNKEKRKSHAG